MNPSPTKKPSFIWQGALIVAPVLLLAVMGIFSVRQDSTLARHEAADRAQTIADELLPRVRGALFARAGRDEHEFRVNSAGQLVFPPPYPLIPVPRLLNPGLLTPKQAAFWRVTAAQSNGGDIAASAQACIDFLKSDPPPEFAAAARYSAALLLSRAGDVDAAATHLSVLLGKYPDAAGESGLPLRPLAEVKMLELKNRGARTDSSTPLTLDEVCSNLVSHPTMLTPRLLARLSNDATTPSARTTIAGWQHQWDTQEASRELFNAVADKLASVEFKLQSAGRDNPGLSPPIEGPRRCVWFRAPGGGPPALSESESEWLAVEDVDASGDWFVCRSEWALGQKFQPLIASWKHLPDYFGVGIEVAGRKLAWPGNDLRVWQEVHYLGGKGAGQVGKAYSGELATTVLGTATSAADQLKINIYLTSPGAMLKYQRVRTFWLGTLLAAAALAAVIGLISAYRAFRRQIRLSDLKSDFVSSVSHELRAPIASVRLMAENLEKGKVTEPARQQEYFRFIDQECRRLSSLVENVLDFSRIEQGRKQYEFEPTDVLAMVRKTIQLMDTYAAERAVRLEIAVAEQEPAYFQLSADGKALQQALVNLIDNAVKHSPKGGLVTIGLETATNGERRNISPDAGPTPEPSAYLRLWVEDKGPGIPPAEHEKIFQRFYRRGSELRRETQGVGIGLSIVKHIVEAHGGRVLVRSDVGQGSRFTIELPMSNGAPVKTP